MLPHILAASDPLLVAAYADGNAPGSFAIARVTISPRDPSAYVNLGYFHLERGDPAMAAGFFSEPLAVDATATAARQGLTDARAAQER